MRNCSLSCKTSRWTRFNKSSTHDVYYADFSEPEESEYADYDDSETKEEFELYHEQEAYSDLKSGRNYISCTFFKKIPIVDGLEKLETPLWDLFSAIL